MHYMFQAVSPPIIRSSKTVHSIGYVSSLLAATACGSSKQAVYSFCAPDYGRRNRLKHVEH